MLGSSWFSLFFFLVVKISFLRIRGAQALNFLRKLRGRKSVDQITGMHLCRIRRSRPRKSSSRALGRSIENHYESFRSEEQTEEAPPLANTVRNGNLHVEKRT